MSEVETQGAESRFHRDELLLAEIRKVAVEHLDLESPEVLSGSLAEVACLRLVDDLGLDSIQLLTLAVELENHFQVALDGFAVDGGSGANDSPDSVGALGSLGDDVGDQAAEVATIGDLLGLLRAQLQPPCPT